MHWQIYFLSLSRRVAQSLKLVERLPSRWVLSVASIQWQYKKVFFIYVYEKVHYERRLTVVAEIYIRRIEGDEDNV